MAVLALIMHLLCVINIATGNLIMRLFKIVLISLVFVTSHYFTTQIVFADSLTEAELEKWFNNDDPNPPEFQQAETNDGDLFFLNKKPNKPVHHHRNSLTVYSNSLKDGWVKLEQCHINLDRVARVQILFSKKRIRNIKIINSDSIGKAWVENNSVQLENVKNNALVCIEAWSKALTKNADGSYQLTSGPFMRRFLDGYFPIHVSINVDFKATDLKLVLVEPLAQNGFKISKTAKTVNMDAWFEGRLKTELTFIN